MWRRYPMIYDGRWEFPPSPVTWAFTRYLAAPIGIRRHAEAGLTAVVMSPPDDCFAVAMPYNREPPDGVASPRIGLLVAVRRRPGRRPDRHRPLSLDHRQGSLRRGDSSTVPGVSRRVRRSARVVIRDRSKNDCLILDVDGLPSRRVWLEAYVANSTGILCHPFVERS